MSFTKIETVTAATAQASLTFNAIPSIYDHLVILCNTRRDSSSGTGSGSLQFNGDTNTSGNYTNYQMSSVGFYNDTLKNTQMYNLITGNFETFNCGNSTDTANSFPANTIYIWNYKDTNYKTSGGSHGSQFNISAYNYQTMYAAMWNSTAVISSIRMFPTSGANFVAGSSATLYGITLAGTGATVS